MSVEVSKWCPYVGVSLYRLHVPSAFGRRAGFDMDAKSGLSSGCTGSYHLDEGMHGDGIGRTGARCEVRLPPYSVVLHSLIGIEV